MNHVDNGSIAVLNDSNNLISIFEWRRNSGYFVNLNFEVVNVFNVQSCPLEIRFQFRKCRIYADSAFSNQHMDRLPGSYNSMNTFFL